MLHERFDLPKHLGIFYCDDTPSPHQVGTTAPTIQPKLLSLCALFLWVGFSSSPSNSGYCSVKPRVPTLPILPHNEGEILGTSPNSACKDRTMNSLTTSIEGHRSLRSRMIDPCECILDQRYSVRYVCVNRPCRESAGRYLGIDVHALSSGALEMWRSRRTGRGKDERTQSWQQPWVGKHSTSRPVCCYPSYLATNSTLLQMRV